MTVRFARTVQRSTGVHAASLGEYAPDTAVHAGRVEVMLVNEDGRRESYGRLVSRRSAGSYLVQLTDDAVRGMQWVVATRVEPPRMVFIGFRRGRSADATGVFDHLTEAELDQEAGDWRG